MTDTALLTEATTYDPSLRYLLEEAAEMGTYAFHGGAIRQANPFPQDSEKWLHGTWNAGWDAARDSVDPAKRAAALEDLYETLRAEG